MLVVSALPNVMASVLPAVPTIAVVFATVAVLVKSLKVICVGAAAETDAGVVGGCVERDDIVGRAADQRLDVD